MKLSEFINENLEELQTLIGEENGFFPDRDEIELWIMNDEALYRWAEQNGVYDI